MYRARRLSRLGERLFGALCLVAVILPLGVLVALLWDVVGDALGRLSWDFLTGYPSRRATRAGVLPALVGSLFLVGVTALIALPLGVAAAIWLEEYDRGSRMGRLVEANIANLAGVPSVIYGLLGLGVFVRALGLGRSVLAGAATLALLVLPIVILSSREALRSVPRSVREAAFALGASRWQVVRRAVLPLAAPGILTGAILSISRAIGETAPLVVVGALTYVTFLPDGLDAPFTALPIQIFNWVSRPQEAFRQNAAAGIVVLLLVMLSLSAVAIVWRERLQRRGQLR